MQPKLFKIANNRSNMVPVTNLKDYIYNLLTNIIDDPKDYVTPEAMVIWTRAFTSDTYDPTNNYEEDEYVGDRVLKVAFPKYLRKRNAQYSRKELTNLDMAIMEKKTQSDLAFEMGLVNFVLMPHHHQPPVGVAGDVFESFFGALDAVSDHIEKGLGFITCYNMLVYVFNQNTIPEVLAEGSTKMIVEQVFKQLALPMIVPRVERLGQQWLVTLELNQQAIDFFLQHHLVVPTTLGQSRGYSKNVTIKNAYDAANKTLIRSGVTDAFIDRVKEKKQFVPREATLKERIDINVKETVLSLLKQVVSPSILQQFVTPQRLGVWEKVFHDEPNDKDEDFRYFGEIAIKGLLAKHLWTIYQIDGDYTKEDFNNMMSHISNHYNVFLQNTPWSVLEGRLEVFLGALDKMSDDIYFGISFIHCYKMIELIFVKSSIPYDFRYKHPKTTVEQLLVPFLGKQGAKPDVKIVYDPENHINTFDIKLTPQQLKFLNEQGFKLPLQLAMHSGQNKKQTQKEAYQMAMNVLTEHNVTKIWADNLKRKLEFSHPKLIGYQQALHYKIKQDGYDYVYFASPLKTTTLTEVTIQLVGVTEKQKTILSSVLVTPDLDKQDAKQMLIQNYLNQ